MSKTAFMFPGQGAQYIGMGRDFYENVPVSKEIFDKASGVVGFSMTELCFEENERINITEYTQAAMLTASVAMLYALKEKGIDSDVNAGLSLGEYGALVASGVMTFEDACKVVRQRGLYMQAEVPTGGAMSAVLAMDASKIEEICEQTEGIVTIANYNCPGQIVISGEAKAVESAGEKLMDVGAKRVVPLKVSGPFHSQMLKGAGEKLLNVLNEVIINDPVKPYLSNVTADYVTTKETVKDLLTRQVYTSVRWQQSVERMIADGVDTFVEIGPGKTLSSFVKKINREVKVLNIEKYEDLDKVVSELC